jgi:hypothetical protein
MPTLFLQCNVWVVVRPVPKSCGGILSLISNVFDSQWMKLEDALGKTQIILDSTILNENIRKEQTLSKH